MSAYNLLMNHDEPIPVRASSGPKGIALLAANHQVPILWMALFGPADIRRMSLPDSEVGDIPTMMASTADALRRYAARKGALRRALDARHFDRIAEWERFIQTGLTKAYVQIDFEDFCLVGDLPAFEAELVTWLDGVEHMSGSGWNALVYKPTSIISSYRRMECVDLAMRSTPGREAENRNVVAAWTCQERILVCMLHSRHS